MHGSAHILADRFEFVLEQFSGGLLVMTTDMSRSGRGKSASAAERSREVGEFSCGEACDHQVQGMDVL